jgi:hypothetical protein
MLPDRFAVKVLLTVEVDCELAVLPELLLTHRERLQTSPPCSLLTLSVAFCVRF